MIGRFNSPTSCLALCLVLLALMTMFTSALPGHDGPRRPPPDRHLHEATFKELDLDGDGFITRREMHMADYEKEIPDHEKQRVMKRFDRDGELCVYR